MNHLDKTDEEIVSLVKEGNADIFSEIIFRYEEKLRRYARRFLFDRSDIDDLVQDVFIKTYINLNSFDQDKKFSPWIYRIAHNEYVNSLKKKLSSRVFSLDFDEFLPQILANEKTDSMSEQMFDTAFLDKHLSSVDDKYREPLVLYFFEEMDYKEISQVLRIPVSTVGVRIKRGKDKLKKILLENNFIYGEK
jgi:RNA polymerase sigma-70 factor (ECF subfamily)